MTKYSDNKSTWTFAPCARGEHKKCIGISKLESRTFTCDCKCHKKKGKKR